MEKHVFKPGDKVLIKPGLTLKDLSKSKVFMRDSDRVYDSDRLTCAGKKGVVTSEGSGLIIVTIEQSGNVRQIEALGILEIAKSDTLLKMRK